MFGIMLEEMEYGWKQFPASYKCSKPEYYSVYDLEYDISRPLIHLVALLYEILKVSFN
jgi:hypothetical protein